MNRNNNINKFRKKRIHEQGRKYILLNSIKPVSLQTHDNGGLKPVKQIVAELVRQISAKKKKKNNKHRILAFLLAATIGISGLTGIFIAVSSKFALLEVLLTMMNTSHFIGDTNIMVVGLDKAKDAHRTDTIMVVHIAPQNKKVSVVSIPRDTIVRVPKLGLTKINHAFAYGGTKLTRKTLENFLNIKIPFTVTINMKGLANIIDTLGGVVINVEKRMYYVDYAGGLYIDLYPGRQLLNGKKAIGYVRFRKDGSGDFGRITRQQKFVKALANRIVTHKEVLKTPKFIMSLLSNVDTNMNTRQVLGISMSMRQATDFGNVQTATIPGSGIMINKIYYLKPNLIETEKMVSKMLRQNKKQGYVGNAVPLGVLGVTL